MAEMGDKAREEFFSEAHEIIEALGDVLGSRARVHESHSPEPQAQTPSAWSAVWSVSPLAKSTLMPSLSA